jgi:WD40 repeat protein
MFRSWFCLSLVVLLGIACPAVARDEADIQRLIRMLGADEFETREAAAQKLEALGCKAWPALRKAAATETDPEIKARARELVERIGKNLFGEAGVYKGHAQQVNCMALSPDGKTLLTGSFDRTARLWDVATGKELRKLEGQPGGVWSAVFSPTDAGRAFLTAGMALEQNEFVQPTDYIPRLWDLAAGKELVRFVGHTEESRSLALSPDGRRLLSASRDRTIRLWDAATGKELRKFEGHTSMVRRAVFTPDGKRIVSVSQDKTLRIWDVETGKELRKLTGHTDDVLCLTLTPDGKQAISAGADRSIRVWDLATGREVRKLDGHTTVIWGLAVSPDGSWLVSGAGSQVRIEGFYEAAGMDFDPRVWDLTTGEEVYQLKGHAETVMSVMFAPDGHVFTASSDATVRRWRVGLVEKR